MTDKVQKIYEEITKKLEVMQYQVHRKDAYKELKSVLAYIDSLQEEPVSEDLREASYRFACKCHPLKTEYSTTSPNPEVIESFKAGAKWQKEHLWKPADGDDLPEYDREVIAIHDYVFGHYMVAYVHRPNPNGWNGTNIDTGEKEHFEPKIYDKGGWNQPHVLYWLDARLPYEENKIDKEI